LLLLLAGIIPPAASAYAGKPLPRVYAPAADVTAYELIAAMNTLRMSNGLPALVEDPIVNAVAQSTAEIMAANQMSWHIGDASGRLAAAGYGGGAKVWATENFAVGNHSIDEIMIVWSDASHMIPAVNPAYCHVGAGVAKSSNGRTYYVLQAAYVGGQACGEYRSPAGAPGAGGTGNRGVPGIIVPVKVATPDAEGKIFHEVKAGQSFWAIAIAYKITIRDLETWNNISRDSKLQPGQKLFIPSSNTEGYFTPTPVGMVETATPDPEGKVVHVVQPYQTLITIAQAYKTKVDTLLVLNGIQADWPLQINQKLLVNPGRATLSPLEKLEPESDGRYYHTIQTGETLSWIAQIYGVTVSDLMNWNGLNAASILYPNQKLLLQVTPPATQTTTPIPPAATLTATPAPLSPTPTYTPTGAAASPTSQPGSANPAGGSSAIWFLSLGLAAGGLLLVVFFTRKKL
jgi:LysM repeat protein